MNKIPFEYGSIAENPFYRFGQMMTLKKLPILMACLPHR